MKKVFLVDAYALIYKFYYAFMRTPMRSPAGDNVSTVFGFIKYINELVAKQKPDLLGVAFDVKGGSFRNEMYEQYKANRDETPEDIIKCTPIIKRYLEAKNIPVLEVPGYEADDVIGTLSVKAKEAGYDVYMVTPDKDFGQLVQDHISIFKPAKGDNGIEIVTAKQVCETYGISDPKHVIDILAIWGDASDNIPGVRGVGEKGASKLVGQFGTVENILENLDQLSEKQRAAFEEGREQLAMSKKLATISLDVPIEFCEERLHMGGEDPVALGDLYMELGFRSFLADLRVQDKVNEEAKAVLITFHEPSGAVQQTLFDFGAPVEAPPVKAAKSAQDINYATQKTLLEEESTEEVEEENSINVDKIAGYKNVKNTPHSYVTVNSPKEMDILMGEIIRAQRICVTTKTTSVEPMRAKLVGVAIATTPHKAYWFEAQSPWLQRLKPFLEDPTIDKIGQNIKYDIIVLKKSGIELKGRIWDTMIMHYILDPESKHSKAFLASQLLSYEVIDIEKLIGKGVKQITLAEANAARVAEYAAEDADITLQLFEDLLPKLRGAQKETLYDKVDEPLIRVLAELEFNGIAIDNVVLKNIEKELNLKEREITDKIKDIAGVRTFNVNSPKQLGVLLFDKLKIGHGVKNKKTGSYRTDEQTLSDLSDKHEIIPMILAARGIKKLLSTYIEVLPTLVHLETGRIHTSFNQAVTATGRLSSSNPNLQNIPIRTDDGKEIRRAFVSGIKGWKIVAADYSQVELRIMAHLSQDKNMIEAFASGEDIHTATAAKIYGLPIAEVTPEQRRNAKMANFGIIYGVTAAGLGQRLQVPMYEARKLIDSYFATYPGVKAYMEKVASDAHHDGYVETMFGRRRVLEGINSTNHFVRSFAERNAVNAPIQGSAADIMKLAMIEVSKALREGGFQARLLLQVHDELVLEAPENEVEKLSAMLIEKMERAANLDVKLDVGVGVGDNWLEAH